MAIDGLESAQDKRQDVQSRLEEYLLTHKTPIIIALVALTLLGMGYGYYKNEGEDTAVEVITEERSEVEQNIIVEVAGAVEKPGVYELTSGARVEDLLVTAGGVAADADHFWIDKTLNRAAKLSDGQKLYIPTPAETSGGIAGWQSQGSVANNSGLYQNGAPSIGTQTSGLTNINSATLSDLDKLPGIGPVYGQKIIDQRPYSEVSDLTSRGVIPNATYEKIKDLIAVY